MKLIFFLNRKTELVLLALYIFLCFTAWLYISSELLRSFFGSAGCHLYNYTGLYCPACGGTRAMIALLSGDVVSALSHNLLILLLPLFLYIGLFLLNMVIKGRSVNNLYIRPVFLWGLLATIILFGVLRNIPASIFELLRP